MKKHIRNTTRYTGQPSIPQRAWCPNIAADEFCYSFTCEDGMKGLLRTGGIAGVHEFIPLFPCVKQ